VLTIERIARWLYSLYPVAGSEALGALQPDLLLEYLVTRELTGDALLERLFADLPADRASHALEMLIRARDHYPEQAAELIQRLLAANVKSLILPALLRFRDDPDPVLAGAVAEAMATADFSLADFTEIARGLGAEPPALAAPIFTAAHAAIGDFAVGRHDIAAMSQEADLLYFHGCRLAGAELFAEAAAALASAVGLYREAYAAAPDDYRPDLALGLMHLGAALEGADQCAEALGAVSEGIELYRAALGMDDPELDPADLARALASEALILSALERCPKALAPVGEGIELLRAAHESDPDEHRADLAHALLLRGAILRALGPSDDEEASGAMRSAISEAVDLYRAAHTGDPDRHGADLALALTYLGTVPSPGTEGESESPTAKADRESAAAKRDKPLLTEAVELYRSAYVHAPDQYRAELALALSYLGSTSWSAWEEGDSREDLRTEAADLYRESGLGWYRPRLAVALANLWDREQSYFSYFRRFEEVHFSVWQVPAPKSYPRAFASDPCQLSVERIRNISWNGPLSGVPFGDRRPVLQECIGLWRQLHVIRPDRFRLELALSLYNLGLSFNLSPPADRDNRIGAAACIEAAGLCLAESSAGADRERYILLRLLPGLGNLLGGLGYVQEARLVRAEYVRLRREDPEESADSRAELARELLGLARNLRTLKLDSEASAPLAEAIALYRGLLTDSNRWSGPEDRLGLADSLSCLGDLMAAGSRPREAEESYREAVFQYRAIPGVESSTADEPAEGSPRRTPQQETLQRASRVGAATALVNLAAVLDRLGRPDEANSARQAAGTYQGRY
jgi:hypothetical protein